MTNKNSSHKAAFYYLPLTPVIGIFATNAEFVSPSNASLFVTDISTSSHSISMYLASTSRISFLHGSEHRMRAASALFLRAENGPQQPPQNPRRLPDNDPHAPPLLSSQARSAAGNQEPGHQKHQRSHRKDGRDEDPCPQRQGAHTDQRPTVPSSHPHPSSATVYAGSLCSVKRAAAL